MRKLQAIFFSNFRNKRSQCYDWWKKFFGQVLKNYLTTYDTIRQIATGQGDDYTAGCLLDYTCFEKYCKLIEIYFSKKQKLDPDPEAIQNITFTGNLDQDGNTRI